MPEASDNPFPDDLTPSLPDHVPEVDLGDAEPPQEFPGTEPSGDADEISIHAADTHVEETTPLETTASHAGGLALGEDTTDTTHTAAGNERSDQPEESKPQEEPSTGQAATPSREPAGAADRPADSEATQAQADRESPPPKGPVGGGSAEGSKEPDPTFFGVARFDGYEPSPEEAASVRTRLGEVASGAIAKYRDTEFVDRGVVGPSAYATVDLEHMGPEGTTFLTVGSATIMGPEISAHFVPYRGNSSQYGFIGEYERVARRINHYSPDEGRGWMLGVGTHLAVVGEEQMEHLAGLVDEARLQRQSFMSLDNLARKRWDADERASKGIAGAQLKPVTDEETQSAGGELGRFVRSHMESRGFDTSQPIAHQRKEDVFGRNGEHVHVRVGERLIDRAKVPFVEITTTFDVPPARLAKEYQVRGERKPGVGTIRLSYGVASTGLVIARQSTLVTAKDRVVRPKQVQMARGGLLDARRVRNFIEEPLFLHPAYIRQRAV